MAAFLSEFEAGLQQQLDGDTAGSSVALSSGVGILIADPLNRRLIAAASTQLELKPIILTDQMLAPADLSSLELIVADASAANDIRLSLTAREERGEGVNPAVIAVHVNAEGSGSLLPPGEIPDRSFDGELSLPMLPAQVAAQMSLILYAHRAFARRYQNALDELHLNRRIFRSVTSGISVANATLPDMPLVYVNPAFEVITGYCLEEVMGKNCRFLQGSDVDQSAVALLREAIREQREITVCLRNYRKDGSPFWNELSLSPIRNRKQEVTHFVGIQTDVTARMEFEAALRESEKLAAVGRLASSIAHEINNPLESVTNLLYLAQSADSSEETQTYLQQADKELQRVALITSQSLRFYKQSSKPQAIRTRDLLKSVLDIYEGRVQSAHVSIERRERSLNAITCLESEIRQVLNNLIRNAIDAMRERGGRLLIRTRDGRDWRTGTPGVVISIADTGSGISPGTMENLYRPFFTTKGIAGTGLGLWISSEIVARHQGRLKVRSRQQPVPSGTVFQMFLPIEAASASL